MKNSLYTSAITRRPGTNFSKGLTTSALGSPDYATALLQHDAYLNTLRLAGLNVVVLEPDPTYPDGCFVEDTAVVIPEMAVITNPGAQSRKGETESIANILKQYRKLFFIKAPGTLDGGDVLRAGKNFFIGLSARTNEEGIRQFDQFARQFGYTTTAVPLGGILHLKSGIAYIGNERMIAIKEFTTRQEFTSFRFITLSSEERYAANCLRIDDTHLIIGKGYPKIREELIALRYEVTELAMTEFEKMDGGLTCLSLLL